jgi:hypothetical protein
MQSNPAVGTYGALLGAIERVYVACRCDAMRTEDARQRNNGRNPPGGGPIECHLTKGDSVGIISTEASFGCQGLHPLAHLTPGEFG